MKIGILTFHSQLNYGGVLQCWALQTALEKMGHEVVVIDRWWNRDNTRLYGTYRHYSLRQWVGFVKRSIFNGGNEIGLLVRHVRTIRFVKRFLNLTKYHFHDWNDAPANLGVEMIIVGSDQVWRRSRWDDPSPYLLASRDDVQKLAYAVSFGMKRIEPEDMVLYAEALAKFKAISCREAEGVALCESLHVGASHMPDPTLLLTTDEWRRMVGARKRHAELRTRKSLVCYFLSVDIGQCVDALEKFCQKQSCDIEVFTSETMNLKECAMHDRIHFRISAGPLEFVKAMSEAHWVVTDSFHGLMFSTIFARNVRVLKPTDTIRQGMFSRIEEFVGNFIKGECLCGSLQEALDSLRTDEGLNYNCTALEKLRDSAFVWLKEKI